MDGVVGTRTWARLCVRIEEGDSGNAVRALQISLNQGPHVESDTGYANIHVDGVFGKETEDDLRGQQEAAHIKIDGIAGAQTWAALLNPEVDDE